MTTADRATPTSAEPPAAMVGRYAGEWALFADWCAATDHTPLPAEPNTIQAFLTACPAAPASHARRLTAIDAAHRAAGHPPPARTGPIRDLVRGRPAQPGRAPFDPGRVDTALRALPVHGWTGGWFGRRDRALLVLAATGLTYPAIAALTAGDITIAHCVATVTAGGRPIEIAGVDDPTVCRPCALVTWIRALDLDALRGTRALADALKKAPELIGTSPHRCSHPGAIDDPTRTATLLPPIDQHGYTPYATDLPLTPRSISELARDTAAGKVTAHRAVAATDGEAAEQPPLEEPRAVPRRVFAQPDWRRGVEARNVARADLATLDGSLDDLDARIADLERRTRQLMDG